MVDSVNQCSGCSGISSQDPISGPVTAPLGQAVAGRNNLSDNPFTGAIDGGIAVRWTDFITCGNCNAPAAFTWSAPPTVRCDATAGFTQPQGCAIDSFTPTLFVTGYTTGNTSAAFVSFFQSDNVDHWGLYPSGTPLTRLVNQGQITANRTAMCVGFVPDSRVTDDGCDEFPFAGTYQSGRMLGQTARQCSQIVPQFDSTTSSWQFTTYAGYSTSQRCGIGHVVQADNEAVGSMYGTFVLENRVIDGDPFWLAVR